ncbi:MAG TPA: aminodeoxychorismate synthase component I [Halieaceae bacterium]|nr:MAG: aminodeoxychorismate synthase component I [Gammaproteobacteria bacterium]HDY82927.1 aminodeoxychorismate synthase component I [Halieaceae bacterium]
MSKTVLLDEIPYSPDSCELFERIRDLPQAALLDSSYPHAMSGRYDILTAQPISTDLPGLEAGATESECREFFNRLGQFHTEHYAGIQPASQDIPFCGGILGYLGYDCGNSLHSIGSQRQTPFPPVQLCAYDWCVIQDHLLRRAVLVAQPGVGPGQRRDLLARLCQRAVGGPANFRLGGNFTSNFTTEQYRAAFDRIQAYIQAGDCYQVNLAQRFAAPCSGDPWHAYRELRAVAAAPFAAYLALGDNSALMSLSPERFISLHGHHVETSPIKGTRPRYSDPRTDELAAAELKTSDKDRAENLMIVDLLRNDLGRNCVPGSIHVDRLFDVQSFPTVHHLVSTISGELQGDRGATDLLRDSFPGGSITGAPKRRAMEIIAELEPDPRQVYCGSLLYISADGRMDSNIAIRTLLYDQDEVRCWGGGGIVADSQWQQEYRETYDKVGKFLNVLEGYIAS